MKTAWQKWTACLLATLMVLGSVFAGPGVAAWAAGPDDGNAAALPSSAAEPGRETINFNNDWLYYKGDITGAEAVDFEDSEWLYVNLPHSTCLLYTSCNEEGYHKTAPFIGGIMRLPLPNGGGVPRYGSGPGGTTGRAATQG